MRRGRSGVWIVVAVLAVAIVALAAVIVIAVPRGVPAAAPAPDWSHVAVGADASWPVCTPPHGTTRTMPLAVAPAFAIVGVNDGLPGTTSACIAHELAWADTATGGSTAPRLAYYVMAADPWTKPELRWVPHPVWPTADTAATIPVTIPAAFGGTCGGGHAEAGCAYVYGWLMALVDAHLPGLRGPATHRFWIDVEAIHTWSSDTMFNQALVEGMLAGFTTPVADGGVGTTAGIYSTTNEWALITGTLRPGSPLDATDQWLAAGRDDVPRAVALLRRGWALTPHGRLRMVQILDGAIDRDVATPPPAVTGSR